MKMEFILNITVQVQGATIYVPRHQMGEVQSLMKQHKRNKGCAAQLAKHNLL